MSRMESKYGSVMAEPTRYRRSTVSEYNKQEVWGRRLRWLERLGYVDSRNPGQLIRPLLLDAKTRVAKMHSGLYRPGQDWIGTVEMAFCGDPSITRSL
jgi:hypothetical protein